jgi:hypothetical protein
MDPNLPTPESLHFLHSGRSDPAIERLQGIIREVNLLDRDLTVCAGTKAAVFDVPPDCPVFLHGERIKLRLLQPRDRVSIAFMRRDERLVAQKIQVDPAFFGARS